MKAHLDHYRIFCIAASERSFSRAAGQLYISQSAVSQCISQLESDLQTQPRCLSDESRRTAVSEGKKCTFHDRTGRTAAGPAAAL